MGQMSGGYMQMIHHFIEGIWASNKFVMDIVGSEAIVQIPNYNNNYFTK